MGAPDDGIGYIEKKKKYARKVLEIAGSLYVNLPANWCKRNFVRKGDIVHIDVENGDQIHEMLAITAVFTGSED